MDGTLRFQVPSNSTAEVYDVVATCEGQRLSIVCTCMAGQKGMVCRHRTNLIHGALTSLVIEQTTDVQMLAHMVEGTELAKSLAALANLEDEAEKLKRRISGQRKQVARLMFGR